MTFGSGSVTSVIASDVVSVGGQKAKLQNGLLLMVDRRELRIDGIFEGILGLGPKDAMANQTVGRPQWVPGGHKSGWGPIQILNKAPTKAYGQKPIGEGSNSKQRRD